VEVSASQLFDQYGNRCSESNEPAVYVKVKEYQAAEAQVAKWKQESNKWYERWEQQTAEANATRQALDQAARFMAWVIEPVRKDGELVAIVANDNQERHTLWEKKV
jgi:hypothetical protein